jgi:hypothetical protein
MRLELGAHLAVISWPSPRAATLMKDKNRRRAGESAAMARLLTGVERATTPEATDHGSTPQVHALGDLRRGHSDLLQVRVTCSQLPVAPDVQLCRGAAIDIRKLERAHP